MHTPVACMHARRRLVGTLLILAALLPLPSFADTLTTLASNRVRLTQAEIQGLGFFAQFEPALPTARATTLYLVFPERIDGRKFITASAELSTVAAKAATEVVVARNQNAEKVLVIDALDPTRVTAIEFVLQYGPDMRYQVRIDVAGLNQAALAR